MGRRITINGKNVECRSTGKRIPVKRKTERKAPIKPYKMPYKMPDIYEGYRYHRHSNHTKANGDIKT